MKTRLEHESAEAKKRLGHNQHTSSVEMFPQTDTGKARDKAGDAVNVSGRSIRRGRWWKYFHHVRRHRHEQKIQSMKKPKPYLSKKIITRCSNCGNRFYPQAAETDCIPCRTHADARRRTRSYLNEYSGRSGVGCVTSEASDCSKGADNAKT